MCTYVYMFPDGTSEKYNKQTPNISPIGFCQGELWKHINKELLLFSEFVLDNFLGGWFQKNWAKLQQLCDKNWPLPDNITKRPASNPYKLLC